jgi:hypothetical protein
MGRLLIVVGLVIAGWAARQSRRAARAPAGRPHHQAGQRHASTCRSPPIVASVVLTLLLMFLFRR